MSGRPRVTLYTRAGCHLCDDAKRVLDAARPRAEFDLEVIDIDLPQNAASLHLYNEEVPVVAIDGRKAFKYGLDMNEFLKRLAARQ